MRRAGRGGEGGIDNGTNGNFFFIMLPLFSFLFPSFSFLFLPPDILLQTTERPLLSSLPPSPSSTQVLIGLKRVKLGEGRRRMNHNIDRLFRKVYGRLSFKVGREEMKEGGRRGDAAFLLTMACVELCRHPSLPPSHPPTLRHAI